MILLLSFLLLHVVAGPPDADNEMDQLRRQIFRQQLQLINQRYGGMP